MAQGMEHHRQNGLPPVIGEGVSVLIVGTFPGDQSLKLGEYYANPTNQFWRIISLVQGVDLVGLPYRERIDRLLASGLGLWDVYASCVRVGGSDDNKIRDPRPNDFTLLREQYPKLTRVFFNGTKAAKFAPSLDGRGFTTATLHSSSSANTWYSLAQKVEQWQQRLGRGLPSLPPPNPVPTLRPFTQEWLRQAIEEGRE